jgi:hypothetical protein
VAAYSVYVGDTRGLGRRESPHLPGMPALFVYWPSLDHFVSLGNPPSSRRAAS